MCPNDVYPALPNESEALKQARLKAMAAYDVSATACAAFFQSQDAYIAGLIEWPAHEPVRAAHIAANEAWDKATKQWRRLYRREARPAPSATQIELFQ